MTAAPRWGLFGGSFDPVHTGHLHAARAARAALGLERVLFVPARQSPHKLDRRLAPGPRRVELLELALAGEPDFVVDARELERAGPSYTLDTVRELTAERPGAPPAMIIGSDNLRGLPRWRGVHELLDLVVPVVVHRSEHPEELLVGLEGQLEPRELDALRAGFLRLPPVDCSSSEVRGRLARGEALDDALPPGVEARIRELDLYREVDR
ncbi:MAG: nicotinate (nicotinamide) nucleotide adenylyltransferase [Planctomycetes bacterium]|nr:nicotinate (nicotinamide) nucleotide adenylyltransferase [Planctomycetota bacterium]MCB9905343.1 nicotinate (nicotinamide) nucleotide adenylyltransferase [Planctomycetota bacterium]